MQIVYRKILPFEQGLQHHASSITFIEDNPIFSCFSGEREGHYKTYIAILNNDELTKIGNNDHSPKWNPVLFSHEGHAYLFYKSGSFCDRWQTYFVNLSKYLMDKDKSFIQTVPAGINGPVKTKPLRPGDAGFYCGSSVETQENWTSYIETFDIGSNGEFFFHQRSNPLSLIDGYNCKKGGIIQPALFKHNLVIAALFRSTNGKIYYSKGGRGIGGSVTFIEPMETNLLNPNSSVDCQVKDDYLYIIFNDSSVDRETLTLTKVRLDKITEISRENKVNFERESSIIISDVNHLKETCDSRIDDYSGPANSTQSSYPFMIEHAGKLHITFTLGRKFIEYVVVEI
jgi:predicted neuraminidase